MTLGDALASRAPLLLDGGMGTSLIARGLDPAKETAPSWNLRRPSEVLAVHKEHVAAGAELVLTNTFSARAPSPRECEAALRVARDSGARYVAAALWAGQQGLREALDELASADAIWLETATSLPQALEALQSALSATSLPIVVTLACFPPDEPDAFERLRKAGAAAAGLNCSPWPHEPGALVAIGRGADVVKPDAAGLDPESWAREVAGTDAPLRGGCCGATGEHLAALQRALRATPR